jgi:hypothetical protein
VFVLISIPVISGVPISAALHMLVLIFLLMSSIDLVRFSFSRKCVSAYTVYQLGVALAFPRKSICGSWIARMLYWSGEHLASISDVAVSDLLTFCCLTLNFFDLLVFPVHARCGSLLFSFYSLADLRPWLISSQSALPDLPRLSFLPPPVSVSLCPTWG